MKIWIALSISLLLTGALVMGIGCGSARAAEVAGRTLHVSQAELPEVAAEAQFRTIGEAAAQVTAGDTVLIHGGIYRERVMVEASGAADHPIRFLAAPGEYVVVTGADVITDWELVDSEKRIYRTPWPHEFIIWSETSTHPSDNYHRRIGRAEQVFVDNYALHHVLSREELSRGSFFVDLENQYLYVRGAGGEALDRQGRVEASTRDVIWEVTGDYVQVRGIRFRYAANHAQQGAAQFWGNNSSIEDCVFEQTNASGASFGGENIVVRRCTFQDNGQLGFGGSNISNMLITECVIRNNNTKGYNRHWEAGANKICLARGVVFEKCIIVENRGAGIWFDIGNEECVVRNNLIAFNEDAGIYYEISYGLHAHDNVIIGNGLGGSAGMWGADAGISISSSQDCLIERNLLLGNKEGLNFREQGRTTPRIGDRREHPIWNQNMTVRNNTFAYNRDAQVWGWYDIGDQRHWPAAMQVASTIEREPNHPAGMSLEQLNLNFQNNIYYVAPGQGLFNWGVTWDEMHRRYTSLEALRAQLNLDQGGVMSKPDFADITIFDLRVPADSLLLSMDCYPQGEVPGVQLGVK